MFDKLRKAINEASGPAGSPGPPDLAAVPYAGYGYPGGLAVVDPAAVSAYLGLEVARIGPLSKLGPEAPGFLAHRLQEKLRAGGADDLPPGELFAGQNAAREARMRAQGVSEEGIAMMRARIEQVTAEHRGQGWTISFANGTRASAVIRRLDAEDAEFVTLRDRYRWQFTAGGIDSAQDSLFPDQVHRIDGSPFESYYRGGTLAAAGREHEAVASAYELKSGHLEQILAGVAALGLRAVEG
jgi:hypothetical protein